MDALVGGKAKGLQNLKALGLVVPPFWEWIPQGSFTGSLSEADKAILLKQLSVELHFPDYPLALRSNLAVEDGAESSFAGIFESVLGIQTEEELWQAISRVYESYHSERALFYFEKKGVPVPKNPSFLFQQFIEATYSGVALTTFPEYPDEVVIHLIEGRGDALVSGLSEGLELHYCRRKKKWIEELPAAIEPWCNKLRDQLIEIENRLKKPQDIEFAFQDNTLWFLQMRPLTQAIPERIVLDNSNIQESYAGISLPLTFSFASGAYAAVYTQTMRVMLLPEKLIQEYLPVVNNLLYHHKGRIYYTILNWYKGLLLLPSFKQNKSDMEAMMGLEQPVDFIQNQNWSLLEKLRRLPKLLKTYLRLAFKFRTLDQAGAEFRAHFATHFSAFYLKNLSNVEKRELLATLHQLDNNFLQKWTVPIINDFYVMMLNGRLNRKWAKEKRPAKEIINLLLSKNMDIESLAPNRFYLDLAGRVKDDAPFCARLLAGEPMHAWVQSDRHELFPIINAFIQHFGDRTVGELKMETITLRQDPERLYHYLKNYLQTELRPHKEDVSEWQHLAQFSGFKKLKKAIERREALRMDRTRLFGMYRSVFCEAGQRMLTEGSIANDRDLFYLTREEIEAFLSASSPLNFMQTIEERKKKYQEYAGIEVSGHLVLPQRIETTQENRSGDLKGQVILGENLEGEAVVYTMDGPIPDLKGKILCAPRTDPGWVPLFPSCKAVLIEKGSSLSHSVIVLREMGIPCMINIPGLTQTLRSGMKLSIDFENGIIKEQKDV